MEVILGVLLAVGLITAIGHGIWVAVAATVRAMNRLGSKPSPQVRLVAMCPRCGNTWDPKHRDHDCLHCGWSALVFDKPRQPRPDLFLAYFTRRVDLYAKLGLLSASARERIAEMIQAETVPAPLTSAALPPLATTRPPLAAPAFAPEPVLTPVTEAPTLEPVRFLDPEPVSLAPVADLPERARAYRDSLAARKAEGPPEPSVAVEPKPHRGFEVLSSFLEEKSIRWGELVGGLLIVGCSLALVVSFWSSIAERPWLKYGLLNGVTALLFALGGHAERRWKLPTTALGLLIIATLLTPLNFLAVASLVRGDQVASVWGTVGELAGIAIFAVLVWRAGRWLVQGSPGSLVVAVVASSASMLLLRRSFGFSERVDTAVVLASVPWMAVAFGVGSWMARVRGEVEIQERRASELLRLLGLGVFAASVATGLVLAHAGPLRGLTLRMSPLAPLIGATILAPGLWLWRRVDAKEWVGYRIAGTAIAAAGTLILLVGIGLAWPTPARMVPVALLDFAVLTAIAVAFRVPAAHALAGVCLVLVELLGWAVWSGRLGWRGISTQEALEVLLSAGAGTALVPITVFFGVLAAAGARAGRKLDAQAFALVAGLASLVSLGLVTWHGFGRAGDPAGATRVYLAQAAIIAVSAPWLARRRMAHAQALGWLASALLLAALVQGLAFGGFPVRPRLPGIVALLVHASFTTLFGLFLRFWFRSSVPDDPEFAPRRTSGGKFAAILERSALATTVSAAAGLLLVTLWARPEDQAMDGAWLSLIWVVLAWQFASPWLFGAGQMALTWAVVFGTAATVRDQVWFAGSTHPWLDPRMLQAQGVALGLLGLFWIVVRLTARTRSKLMPTLASLLDPPWSPVDRVLRFATVVLTGALAGYAAWPGVARELESWLGSALPLLGYELPEIPHAPALEAATWIVGGLTILVLLAGQWERFRRFDLLMALAVAMFAAAPAAGRWEARDAAASALGWFAAIGLAVASVLIWGRLTLRSWANRLGWRIEPGQEAGLHAGALAVAIVLGVLPVAVESWIILSVIGNGGSLPGLVSRGIFGRLGLVGSVVPPLVLIGATLVGHAIRERSSRYAFAAGLVANLAASLTWLLLAHRGEWLELWQLNAVVASAWSLGWIQILRAIDRNTDHPHEDRLLTATMAIGLALQLVPLIQGVARLWLEPTLPREVAGVAGPLGYLALGLAAVAVLARSRLRRRPVSPEWVGFGAVAVMVFLTLGLASRDLGNWYAYHGVLIGQAMVGIGLPLFAWRNAGLNRDAVTAEVRRATTRWSTVALVVTVLFALRAYRADPQSPWWTVGGLAVTAGLASFLTVWAAWPGYLRLAAVLVNLATTLWWCHGLSWNGWEDVANLVNINIVALAIPAPLWLRLERAAGLRRIPFQRIVAWLALGLLTLVVITSLGDEALLNDEVPIAWLGWLAVAVTAVAMGAGLRDRQARTPVAGLYLLGLVASGWVVAQFHLPPRWLAWTGTMVLAAYSVGTSYLWSCRAGLRGWADRLGFPRPDGDDPVANLRWLVPANLVLAAAVLALAFGIILNESDVVMRSASAHAALAQVLAIGLLARGARRTRLQTVALAVGVVGAIAWGWAWIAPGSATGPLDRGAVVLAATAGAAALYGLGLSKLTRRDDDWTQAAGQLVPSLLGVATMGLVIILAFELGARSRGEAFAMSVAAVVVVGLTLAGSAVAALVAAVVPGRDPLELSEKGRTAYVYGAEILLAALGAHVRLTLPWMFSGRFTQFWPLLLMGLAFLGVGLSEIFRRQGRNVLAEPLERTGAFLPALPMLASFWNAPRPGQDVVYLALVGSLYAVMCVRRSSLVFGALAALAGNGAIWAWLGHRQALGLLAHPQLWVVPPALCVLIGAALNRDRLTRSQMTGIRYAGATAIYLASTADIVLTGVSRAPWLPAVLAALSIAGIFAGIWLRVRGFLFLGLGFLSLAVFSIIWYAAVDLRQTWLWAASGVVPGVVILVVFALFEKKRHEILRVVGELKQWNP